VEGGEGQPVHRVDDAGQTRFGHATGCLPARDGRGHPVVPVRDVVGGRPQLVGQGSRGRLRHEPDLLPEPGRTVEPDQRLGGHGLGQRARVHRSGVVEQRHQLGPRGRGDEVKVYPLSFREFYEACGQDKMDAYNEYSMYGGMPYLFTLDRDEDKYQYLSNLFEEIYFKDIEERYSIALPGVLRELTSDLCSSIGSLTNANKISRTLQSVKHMKVDSETISLYLNYLTESFLFSEAVRYDIKGKKYFDYPSKYYCTDIGLRNVRLGLRQQEETHIMENLIYNELIVRGCHVDVGVIPIVEKNQEGKREQKNCEIDFIAASGSKRYYIQSALNMDDPQKEKTEIRPLSAVKDSFKKIIVSKSYGKSWTDEAGILRINIIDFLLDENSLER
jgi:predicted AAA+ superfamily ATPase